MTPLVAVERRYSYQPVNAAFGLQVTVSEWAFNPHGHALYAGFFSGQQLYDRSLELVSLGEAQVHAQQDLGPVLAFGAAGTGVNSDIGVTVIVLAAEVVADFQLGDEALAGLADPIAGLLA